MVHIIFPPTLTEEEEILKQKYAKLRKKKKALLAARAPKPEKEQPINAPTKRAAPENAGDATQQAKKLLKLGAIKIKESQEKQNFKRSKNFEKRKDSEKIPAVGFQPFSSSHQDEEEKEKNRPRARGLYDTFVSGGTEREGGREREPPPKKGHTIYVNGNGISEDILRKAFKDIGTISHITMEKDKNVGFVTFESMDASDKAIAEVNGAMFEGVQLRVSMARRQPTFDSQSNEPQSTASWSTIAASSSQKGNHRDRRGQVHYEDEDLFG
ncbi:negative elongation factor E-like [Mytilus galloprovincialis]|uniref:Negative elongation factor E n=2 Tax=Mytilus TaxID=6548 RepID=A0A8B6GW27_MYTGA|nr:NELFE [Mytilus edulis]VDI69902.1 negative elongation factor E [Mytilus galloprovincialis]